MLGIKTRYNGKIKVIKKRILPRFQGVSLNITIRGLFLKLRYYGHGVDPAHERFQGIGSYETNPQGLMERFFGRKLEE